MSVPHSVATILREHVTLEVESIDRMYLNVYVPQLQHTMGIVSFFRTHRGATFVSGVLMDAMTKFSAIGAAGLAGSGEIPSSTAIRPAITIALTA